HYYRLRPQDRQVFGVQRDDSTFLQDRAHAIESCHHNNGYRDFLGTVVVKLSSTPASCHDRGVRRTISALTTVAAAAVLAVVTVFVPNLPLWVSPAVLSVLVIGFSIAWPVTVSPTPRWGISAVLALTGLASVWVVSLLPAHVEFSPLATELWLAPVGGAAALGVLLIFGVQTFS